MGGATGRWSWALSPEYVVENSGLMFFKGFEIKSKEKTPNANKLNIQLKKLN